MEKRGGWKLELICLASAFLILFFAANSAYAADSGSANISFTILAPATEGWTNISYPEGVYEPYNTGLSGTHLSTFYIRFNNFTANINNTLECTIMQSDGSLFSINKTITSNIVQSSAFLNYTVQNSDSATKYTPWKVENCTLYKNSTYYYQTSSSSYGSRLNKSIFVHGNTWTKFDSVDNDAYRAAMCFLGIPKRYFNNTHYCDYVGDVAFAVSMAQGFAVEGYCDDNIDGDNNGDTDCDDRYCRGLPYTCVEHAYAGDPFEGTCSNGLCWETKSFGGHSITYYYNRYVQPGGTLKIRFDGGTYSTTKPISYSITDLLGFTAYGNYTDSYQLPSISTTAKSIISEDSNGYSGDVDQVLWVNLSSNYTAGNWYNVSIYLVHEGYDLLVAGIPIFISALAPSVWDESSVGTGRGSPCANSIDEDIDYKASCKDQDCNGVYGGPNCTYGGRAYCQYGSETTCHDCFDNNADGAYDCGDVECDLLRGSPSNASILCHYYGEGHSTYDGGLYDWKKACADGFSNDQEDGIDCLDTTHCWQKGGTSTTDPCPAFENNTNLWCHDSINNDYDERADCADYDCRNITYSNATYTATCPADEAYDKFGNYAPLQCFDTIDNDLDSPIQKYTGLGVNIDCADLDCMGVTNPNNNFTCLPYEYNLSLNITPEYCQDLLDNDGDKVLDWPTGGLDCADPDCNKQFGVCGPCPSVENHMWDSCANSIDDDTDRPTPVIDCEDPDCIGAIGDISSAQICASDENTLALCTDNFDNDADGKADCADSSCDGIGFCENATETSCSDANDNDGDGKTDCIDPDCFGVGSCASKAWSVSSCISVPHNTSYASVGSTTIQEKHTDRNHRNDNYYLSIKGSSSYNSVTITLGNGANSSEYFPYDATSCTLSGDTAKIRWVASQATVGQLQDRGAFTGGFEVLLTCSGLGSAQATSYPLIVSNELSGSTESAEIKLSSEVYETTAPSVSEVEFAPASGSNIEIEYGDSLWLRGITSNDTHGICACYFNFNGTIYSSDGNCIYEHTSITSDGSYSLSAASKDGVQNTGSYGGSTSITVDVTPALNGIAISRTKPFYNASASDVIGFTSSFTTGDSDTISSCSARIKNATGGIVASKSVTPTGTGSTKSCTDSFYLSSFGEGVYYLSINATDSDGDSKMSDSEVFYVCNSYDNNGTGWDCRQADFDRDGSADNCNYSIHYEIGVDMVFTFDFVSNYTLKITSIYEAITDMLLLEKETNSSYLDFRLPAGQYDVDLDVFNGKMQIKLDDIGLDIESNYTFFFDMFERDELQTYAFDATTNFSFAKMRLSYAHTSYLFENNMRVQKCDDWVFANRTCLSGFYEINATINTDEDYIEIYNITSFSGFNLYEIPPKPRWENILYPEGVYEPYNTGLPGTHLHTFFLEFVNLNATNGELLNCLIKESDSTILSLNRTISGFASPPGYAIKNISLNYTITNNDSVSKLTPWKVINCTITNATGIIMYSDDPEYTDAEFNVSRLNKSIFVHPNTWTKFDTVDDDAYRASRCFLGIPKRYFNNTHYCDYVGDVAFSLSMAKGFAVEGYCDDNIDGDNNGDTDCDDRYCRGLPYTCLFHRYAGDPFEGVCSNGLCWETKSFGGHSITYYYNRYVQPNGTLKIRFDGGSYSTTKPISYAITDLLGFTSYGNYTDSYQLPSLSTTATSFVSEDSNGYTGDVDQVLWVNLSSDYTAGNWYNVSIYLVHEGFDLLVAGIPIYISAAAPSVWDESSTGDGRSSPCSSSVDEDIDYVSNCKDLDCNGSVGGTDCIGGSAYCEYGAVEYTCYDCFDNNADGAYDCGDSDCDLKRGSYSNPSALCHYFGEGHSTYNLNAYNWTIACADSFNNDQEDGTDCYDYSSCWGRGGSSTLLPCPSKENNTNLWCHDSINNDYDARSDCADYDCKSVSYSNATYNASCPSSEAYDKFGNYAPLQCFDSIDNDLDSPTQQYTGIGTNIDCADADCTGAVHPISGVKCMLYEYNLSLNITADYCQNSLDDDADNYKGWPLGGTDCRDIDCNKQFGVCGPCPSFENITWDSCANSIDDDTDMPTSLKDCADPDCLGEIGSTQQGQRCTSAENTLALCTDGFNNDNSGSYDCFSSSCNGVGICEYGTESTCNDDKDNDYDSSYDCLDINCYGIGSCAAKAWTSSGCTVVPHYTGWTQVSSSTIYYNNLHRHYANSSYTIIVRGDSSYYASVTITLGDATNSSIYFPYNATSCTLAGDTSKVRWVASQASIGQIQDMGSPISGGFEVNLTCTGLPSPQINSFPISAANELSGGQTETGETSLSATVYETSAPIVSEVEIGPWDGAAVNIEYSSSFKIRAVPSADPSNICQCIFNASSTSSTFYTTDGECRHTMPSQTDDITYLISAAARDGAYNLGSYGGLISVPVNVMPRQNSISIDRAEPFYNASASDYVSFASSFTTASSGSIASCSAWIENNAGAIVALSSATPSGGSTASCSGSFNISSFADGIYYLAVNATDEDSDSKVSDKKPFYVCSSFASSGTGFSCAKADFDQDGMPDTYNCNFSTQATVTLNFTLSLLTSTSEPTEITIYDSATGSLIAQNSTNTTSISFALSAGNYDIQFDAYGAGIIAVLKNISITSDEIYDMYFDLINTTVYGLKTFTVDSGRNISEAEVEFSYANLSYSDESKLHIEVCDLWDRVLKVCNGSWVELASSINSTARTISASSSSLGGFAIVETGAAPSGGGGGGCSNECTPGEGYCTDFGGYACIDSNSDGCFEWEFLMCAANETCENGFCIVPICFEDWVCAGWSECSNGVKARNCVDWNDCGTELFKPLLDSACTPEEMGHGAPPGQQKMHLPSIMPFLEAAASTVMANPLLLVLIIPMLLIIITILLFIINYLVSLDEDDKSLHSKLHKLAIPGLNKKHIEHLVASRPSTITHLARIMEHHNVKISASHMEKILNTIRNHSKK